MNTRTLLTLLLALTVGTLAACGGGTEEEEFAHGSLQPVDCKAQPQQCR